MSRPAAAEPPTPPPEPSPVLPAPARRWVPELPLAVVLCLVTLGLLVVYLHHFRIGSLVIAAGVLLAAVLRLTLSARLAGLLVVRGRGLDATVLGALGIAVLVLALVVPSLRT